MRRVSEVIDFWLVTNLSITFNNYIQIHPKDGSEWSSTGHKQHNSNVVDKPYATYPVDWLMVPGRWQNGLVSYCACGHLRTCCKQLSKQTTALDTGLIPCRKASYPTARFPLRLLFVGDIFLATIPTNPKTSTNLELLGSHCGAGSEFDMFGGIVAKHCRLHIEKKGDWLWLAVSWRSRSRKDFKNQASSSTAPNEHHEHH